MQSNRKKKIIIISTLIGIATIATIATVIYFIFKRKKEEPDNVPPPPPEANGKAIFIIMPNDENASLTDVYYKYTNEDWKLLENNSNIVSIAYDNACNLYGSFYENANNGSLKIWQDKEWIPSSKSIPFPAKDIAFSNTDDGDILYLLSFDRRDLFYILPNERNVRAISIDFISGNIFSITGIPNGIFIAANNLWLYSIKDDIFFDYGPLQTDDKIKIYYVTFDSDGILLGYSHVDNKIYKKQSKEFESKWIKTKYFPSNLPIREVIQLD